MIATIIISLVLAAVIGLIIYRMVKRKKAGKGSCSCGCSGCAMSEICHKDEK